jgi:hypothetical protein
MTLFYQHDFVDALTHNDTTCLQTPACCIKITTESPAAQYASDLEDHPTGYLGPKISIQQELNLTQIESLSVPMKNGRESWSPASINE